MPIIGPAGISQHGGALIAQLIVAMGLEAHPATSFEQHHGQAGLAEFFGDDPAAGSGPNHNGIHLFESHSYVFR
jgi:hypothetical protein